MTNKIKLVIFDDAKAELSRWEELWGDVLVEAGFEHHISSCNVREAADKELLKRPHIMVVDNVFINNDDAETDNYGLEFVYENASKFSDVMFILFTGETFRINSLVHHMPGPALIVPKSGLPSATYRKALARIIADGIGRLPIGDIVFPSNPDLELRKSYKHELRSIVEQCFRQFHNKHVNLSENQLNFEPISGGLSGSHVFRVSTASMRHLEYVPFIMKVAKKDDRDERNYIKEEVERYNAFVRFSLPNELRVDLLGYGEAGGFAGVMYGFAFGNVGKIQSSTYHLKNGDLSFLPTLRKKLFCNEQIGWYRPNVGDVRIVDYFANSEEYSNEKDRVRLRRQNELAQRFRDDFEAKFDSDEVIVDGQKFESVRQRIQKLNALKANLFVCHGDLNSNNIFIDEDESNISLIDFEYCGLEIFGKDLISFELSLRLFFPKERLDKVGFWNLFSAEKGALSALKGQAADNTVLPYGDFGEWRHSLLSEGFSTSEPAWFEIYLIGLAFHCFKILAINGWNKEQYLSVLAIYIASLDLLSEL